MWCMMRMRLCFDFAGFMYLYELRDSRKLDGFNMHHPTSVRRRRPTHPEGK